MSCLKHSLRINSSETFKDIYKNGKQYHRPTFVLFFKKSEELGFAFVSSKRVGNAIKRNRSKRILRATLQNFCNKLKTGSYIFVAKEDILKSENEKLSLDLNRGLKYLSIMK